MTQAIPDGTPCMVVKALPEYTSYLGKVVITTYDEWASYIVKHNLYKTSPPLPDENGRPLWGNDDCLLPIPPKEDDTQQEKENEPLHAGNVRPGCATPC